MDTAHCIMKDCKKYEGSNVYFCMKFKDSIFFIRLYVKKGAGHEQRMKAKESLCNVKESEKYSFDEWMHQVARKHGVSIWIAYENGKVVEYDYHSVKIIEKEDVHKISTIEHLHPIPPHIIVRIS